MTFVNSSLLIGAVLASGSCFLLQAKADEPVLRGDAYTQALQQCVDTAISNLVQQNAKTFRTQTRYLEAPNNGFTICASLYSPCKLVSNLCGDHRESGNVPILNGEAVEGQIYNNGTYTPFPDCSHYAFTGNPSTSYDGLEKFDMGAQISRPTELYCRWYTAGGGFGKGGGHIYGACRAPIVPVPTNDDIVQATEQCMDSLP